MTYSVSESMDNPYRQRIREEVEDQFANFQLNFDRKFGDHYVNAIAWF